MLSSGLIFLAGLVVGVLLTGVILWKLAPRLMLVVHQSRLPFDQTVERFIANAQKAGWQVPKVYELQHSLAKAGFSIPPLKVVSICHPRYAAQVLAEDENKMISAIMPCRIGIYQTKDGKVYVAAMNTALMSKMFGSQVARIMQDVAAEERAMLEDIVVHQ